MATCIYCRDTGRNGANGYPCLNCAKGIALQQAQLAGVAAESLTDRLTRMWHELQTIMDTDTPASNAVGYDLWEAAKHLSLAIERVADSETADNLRRHLQARQAERLTHEADRDTELLPIVGS